MSSPTFFVVYDPENATGKIRVSATDGINKVQVEAIALAVPHDCKAYASMECAPPAFVVRLNDVLLGKNDEKKTECDEAVENEKVGFSSAVQIQIQIYAP